MKALWEKLEKNWMQFTIEVEPDRLSRAVDKAYRKLVKTARIPGFRPGKAPRFIFEQYYGSDHLANEALEDLVPEVYGEAVAEAGAEPIDRPEFEVKSAQDGAPLVLQGKVQVKPEVKLGPIQGFDISYPEVSVTEEQVDEQLKMLKERAAQLVPDEQGIVREGAFATIDFEGSVDGVMLEEMKGEGHTLEIGSGRFIPGFEEKLAGMKVGETRTIKITFPEDYHAEHLRGKEASFNVTVGDLKKKEYPELNDDFAKQVQEQFQTLQELRDDITNKLRDAAEKQSERDWRNSVIDAVANAAEVELPKVMIHRRVHSLVNDFAHTLMHQGINLETYMKVTGKDEESLHKEFEEPAAYQTKIDLVLDAVAKQEGLSVTEEEVDAEFAALASQYGDRPGLVEMRRNAEYRSQVRESLLKQKVLDHVLALNRPTATD